MMIQRTKQDGELICELRVPDPDYNKWHKLTSKCIADIYPAIETHQRRFVYLEKRNRIRWFTDNGAPDGNNFNITRKDFSNLL